MIDTLGESRFRTRIHAGAFWGLAAVVAATMIGVHLAAGMTLPAPWGDEAFFVWQARAFERWNHFAAPELDATRPIILLPFIYQFLLGMAFKIFGYSFDLARAISLVFTLGGFGLLALGASRRAAPLCALVLISAFMFNAPFVAMANNSRMEALLFVVICGAMYLMQTGRIWLALAALAFTPMIHPNGVLFLVPAAIFSIFWLKIHQTRPSRNTLILFGAAAAVWIANAAYALSNPQGLMHDLAYRFAETSSANSGWTQYGGWHAVLLIAICGTGFLAAWRKVRVGYLIVFAIGSWLMHRVRVEQWYEVFGTLAYLLLSLALLEIALQTLPNLKTRFGQAPTLVISSVLLIAMLGFHLLGDRIPGPRNYLQDLTVDGMRITDGVPYFTADDRAALAAYVADSEAGGAKTVELYPWGDTLLVGDFEASGLRFQIPYFDPAFSAGSAGWPMGYGPTEWATADVYIVRTSRYQPRWLDERFKQTLARAEARAGQPAKIIRSRDGTEVWYAVRSMKP
jgi:hypothetical protein